MDDAEKKERLAQALRENLKKRKAQSREQRDLPAPQRARTHSEAE